MFFLKMAICEYLILAIFGQFWLFRAHFGPWVSKMYLLQLFRCKKNNEITKSGSISLFGKLDSPGAPKSTLGPKTPLKGPGRAKIGVSASHVVQLTGFGPKKTNLNRSVQRCVPFTRNQPAVFNAYLFDIGWSFCQWSEAPPDSDYLSLSRYLSFFQFYITDICQISESFSKSINMKQERTVMGCSFSNWLLKLSELPKTSSNWIRKFLFMTPAPLPHA